MNIENIKNDIEGCATAILNTCVDDYGTRIWGEIKNDVIADVLECSDAANGGGFTDGDVKLGIGRAIGRRIGVGV